MIRKKRRSERRRARRSSGGRRLRASRPRSTSWTQTGTSSTHRHRAAAAARRRAVHSEEVGARRAVALHSEEAVVRAQVPVHPALSLAVRRQQLAAVAIARARVRRLRPPAVSGSALPCRSTCSAFSQRGGCRNCCVTCYPSSDRKCWSSVGSSSLIVLCDSPAGLPSSSGRPTPAARTRRTRRTSGLSKKKGKK